MKMQLSCSCCTQINGITIKGIDKADGTTLWEYGPGSFWRHHYGANAITGIVPNLSATLDKYAIVASAFPGYSPCGNRNTGTLAANCCEPFTITKLDSLDGTVIESATLQGFFCDVIGETFVGLVAGISILNAAALSGGDYVIVGERLPAIEFLDYTSNGATKEYILHAHGQREGNVYLKTRTSNETITIPFDSTASAVEALFEATADCVSATASGGPWPLKPITIEVEWSASSGDIAGIATTPSFGISAGGVEYETENDTLTEVGVFTITTTRVKVGAQFRLTFPRDDQFTYTSTTTDIAQFTEDLRDALAAWLSESSAQSGLVPDDNFSANHTLTGNVLTFNFVNVAPDNGAIIAEVIAGGGGTEDTRRSGSCAASYDTGTGEMLTAVGYQFGRSQEQSSSEMFSEVATIPTVTGLNILGISSIGSGPSNSIILTALPRGAGDAVRANVVEKWAIVDGVWEFGWQSYCNATMLMPQIILCEAGYVICPIGAKIFDGTNERTAARLQVSTGTIEELNTTYGSISPPDNWSQTQMFDDTAGSYLTYSYDVIFQDQGLANNRFRINPRGSDCWLDGEELRIGGYAFGCDGSTVYGISSGAITGGFRYDGIGESTDSEIIIQFYATPYARSAEPQQFRFKVVKMPGTNVTSWLDWYATESEIESALNALLGSGNCSIVDYGNGLGNPIAVNNDPVSLIEHDPGIQFKVDTGFSPGSGRIPGSYFTFRNDGQFAGTNDVIIETRDTTAAASGIAAYDAANATVIWSRAFGSAGARTISQPLYAWLQGDFVYAYGQLVDGEL